MKSTKSYSVSIILPILNEINSLKKTLKVLDKISVNKEFLIIYSNKITEINIKKQIFKLKTKYKNIRFQPQKRPFVGGAIDLGIKLSKKKYIVIMASDLETDPYELENMINISKNNQNILFQLIDGLVKKVFQTMNYKIFCKFFFQKLINSFLDTKF